MIYDKIDLSNTCYLKIWKTIKNETKIINQSNYFNDCFRGFFKYDNFTERDTVFNIKIKDFNYQKNFTIISGFYNNIKITFGETKGLEFNNHLSIEIATDPMLIVYSIECFKNSFLEIEKRINSQTVNSYDINNIKSNSISIFNKTFDMNSYFNEWGNQNKISLNKSFNFYDNQKFQFEIQLYDDLFLNFNSTDKLYCNVCYNKKDYCFKYYSNFIKRLSSELQNNTNSSTTDPPFPINNNNTDNSTSNSTANNNNTDNSTSNSTANNNTNSNNSTINNNTNINNSTINNNTNNDNQDSKNNSTTNNSTSNNNTKNNTDDNTKNRIILDIDINPLRNDSNLINDYKQKSPKDQENQIYSLVMDLNKTKPEESLKEKLQKTVTVDNLISNTNCSKFPNFTECNENLKKAENRVIDTLTDILNCNNISSTIKNVENPSDDMLMSALAVYFTTSNGDFFDKNKLLKMNQVSKCLIKYSPNLMNKLYKTDENKTYFDIYKHDYLTVITSSSSNLINISKMNSKNFINNKSKNSNVENNLMINYDDYKNGSLILTDDNIAVKKTIIENTILLMKMNLGELDSNSNKTSILANQKSSYNLSTQNFNFYSKKRNI